MGITGKALLMGEATVHPPSNLIYTTNSTYGTLVLPHANESLTDNKKLSGNLISPPSSNLALTAALHKKYRPKTA